MCSVQSVPGPVLCSSSWLCHPHLSSVLHVTTEPAACTTPEIPSREACVVLELPCPTGDVLPCTLTVSCSAPTTQHMLDVGLYSEARTVEVYSVCQDGQEHEEYLGTIRGDACTFTGCAGDQPLSLYRACLKFDFPVSACRVKLLSLGGKQSVLVGEIWVQVAAIPDRSSQSAALLGPSIDMERVQSIMDSMGGKMSPGAEQLMNMVRAQQKNPAPFASHFLQLFGGFQPRTDHRTEETVQQANKAADAGAAAAPPSSQQSSSSDVGSVTSFPHGQPCQDSSAQSLLPLLKNLAVHRDTDGDSGRTSRAMPREDKLDPALEKALCARMERMERNLMKHIDEKVKCLQEHLDTRMDHLVCLLERVGKSNAHVTSGDKLVNGHTDYTHDDADCNVLSVR